MQFYYNLSAFLCNFLSINMKANIDVIIAPVTASRCVPKLAFDAAAVRTKSPDAAAVTTPVNTPHISFDIICGVTGTCTVLMTAAV